MYTYTLSRGLFSLPAHATSVDWAMVNNAPTVQKVRVTVFKGGVGVAKVAVPPGAIEVTVEPSFVTHNANSVGTGQPFVPGFYYEVVVETNDRRVLPMVDIWQDHGGTSIPGTRIAARDFLHVVEV